MYFNALNLACVLAAIAKLSSATGWAQFCDDHGCAVNCGESVSVNNPGCLNENNRHSIKFHGLEGQRVSLVFSPTPNCPCQNYCISDIIEKTTGNCYNLNKTPSATSFRFIGGTTCAKNNC